MAMGESFHKIDEQRFELTVNANSAPIMCTLDRDLAQDDEKLVLMGIDHPITDKLSQQWRSATPSMLGAAANLSLGYSAVLSIWLIHSFGSGSGTGTHLIPIAVDKEGKRVPLLEKQYRNCFKAPIGPIQFEQYERSNMLREHIEPTLQRELSHRGIATPEIGYSTELLAWVEVS